MAVDGFQPVLMFWFEEIDKASWWTKDTALDRAIRERFGALHAAALKGELWAWRQTPAGRLAEVLVIDQFSRNLYRDDPRAFAFDCVALVLAQEAISRGCDRTLEPSRRLFLYMPFMHSESKAIHIEATKLFSQPGMETNLEFELRHKAIIDRFGRYPHRNAALGRESTAEEIAFLAEPGSSF